MVTRRTQTSSLTKPAEEVQHAEPQAQQQQAFFSHGWQTMVKKLSQVASKQKSLQTKRLAAKGAQKQAEPPEHEGLDILADAAALVQASVVSKPVAELHEEPPAAAVAPREVAVSDVGAEPQTTAEHPREAVPDAGAEPEADAELSGEPLPVVAARSAAVPVPRAGASFQAPAEETVRPVPADRVGQAPSQADQDASLRISAKRNQPSTDAPFDELATEEHLVDSHQGAAHLLGRADGRRPQSKWPRLIFDFPKFTLDTESLLELKWNWDSE